MLFGVGPLYLTINRMFSRTLVASLQPLP